MLKRSDTILFLVVALVLCLTYFLYRARGIEKNNKLLIAELKDKIDGINDISLNQIRFGTGITEWSDFWQTNDSIFYTERKVINELFVIRFDEKYCSPCYDNFLYRMKQMEDKIGTQNFLLLITYDKPNFPKILKSKYGFDCSVLGLEREQSDWLGQLDSPSLAFTFVVTRSGQMKYIRYVNDKLEEITARYEDFVLQNFSRANVQNDLERH